MEMISDVLLVAGAFGAAVYCAVLAARLKKFQTLEGGMGGAIAVLSAQVDDMTRALEKARGTANGHADTLDALATRAETVAARLELLLASMHDLSDAPASEAPAEGDRRMRVVRRRAPREALEAAE